MEAATNTIPTCRMYCQDDYTMLAKWWSDQKWTPVPEDMLPDLGMIVSINNKPVCAGFLYISNSKTTWMEWMISDPHSDKNDRNECLNLLIENLTTLAELKGTKYIFTQIHHARLIDRLKELGFEQADTGMTHMIKVIR